MLGHFWPSRVSCTVLANSSHFGPLCPKNLNSKHCLQNSVSNFFATPCIFSYKYFSSRCICIMYSRALLYLWFLLRYTGHPASSLDNISWSFVGTIELSDNRFQSTIFVLWVLASSLQNSSCFVPQQSSKLSKSWDVAQFWSQFQKETKTKTKT